MNKTAATLAFLLLSGMATEAMATVIGFESFSNNQLLINSSIVSDGFNVTHSGSFATIQTNSGGSNASLSGNGTNRLVSFNNSSISFTDTTGSTFSLASFQGGESWISQPHYWATQIMAVGNLAGGGTTTQIFNLDLIKNPLTGMQLFQFNNTFQNLSMITFSGIGGNPEFSLDNITTTGTVPAPATILLFSTGLLGICLTRRKTQSASRS